MESVDEKKKNCMEIDEVLPLIGEFGIYQRLLDALFALINIPLSYHLLIMYFSTFNPPWKCVNNSSICVFNATMTSDDRRRCLIPREEWEYTEPRGYSLVTQFDIHCGNEWLLSLAHSVFFLGWGTGAIVMGWIGDIYGRKAIFFPSMTAIFLVGLSTSFMPNLYLVIVCRFIVGFFITGGSMQLFIIMSEIVGRRHRPMAGITIFATTPVALCILTLKAYFIREWKLLHVVSNAPYLLILAFYTIIPESVRWLQQQGKSDEAMKVIHRIARWNKKELSANVELSSASVHRKSNPLALFGTRKIALSTCVQGFTWMATTTCYYCFLLAANDLNGSPYRDQVILLACEFPALFFSVYCMNRFGRRRSTLISLCVGGAGCLAIAFIPTQNNALKMARVAFGMLGKFTIATALHCLHTWSFELYPTNIRAEGMGFMHVTSHMGAASAPWITKGMHSLGKGAPFVVMSIPSLISAALGMTLPDTTMNRLLDKPEEEKSNTEDKQLQYIG